MEIHSSSLTGSLNITGSLTVKGILTAEEYIVSSSIYYVTQSSISGSSNFGNSLDDTHSITGSMGVTGSLSVTGPLSINGTSYTAATSGTSGAQGPQGNQGGTGPTGPQGNQGPTGTQGNQGPQGNQGGTGPNGPQGNQGPTGSTGPQGPTGPTGNPFGGGTFTGGIAVQGSITATDDITAYYSDDRMKVRIGNIENALSKVQQLNGFLYTNSELANSFGYFDENKQVGLSAQEVQSVLPEIVSIAPFDRDINGNSITGENYLTIKYERIVSLLVEAVKEQQKQIEEIQKKIG